MTVCLKQPIVLVAARTDVGDEIEDLITGQLVEQALGHRGNFRLPAVICGIRFNDVRLARHQRIFDQLDHVVILERYDSPSDANS